MQNTNSLQKFSPFHSCRTQDHNIHASFGLGDIYLGWEYSDLFVWDRYLTKSCYLHIFFLIVFQILYFSRCLGAHSKHVDISYLCLSSKTSWNWRANKQHSHKKIMFCIHKHFHNSWVVFSNTIFRICMVHVKKSGICGLAYSRAYMAIFLPDPCRLKSIGIQAQNQSCKINKHFYMQTFLSIVFQMLALFKILLKVRKMWAQTASSSIFPTDAFLLKLVGIALQQAEVTTKHTFKRIFAILSGSLQIFLFILFVNVLKGISPDRMLLTDCYPLALTGMANSTSTENEEAAVSKLW